MVVIVGIIGFTIISVVLVKSNQNLSNIAKELFSSNRALQILTVAAIIMVIMFLSILGLLKEHVETVLTIISSLAAYVLGSLSKAEANVNKENDKNT